MTASGNSTNLDDTLSNRRQGLAKAPDQLSFVERNWSAVPRTLSTTGLVTAVAGIVLNPPFVRTFISDDGILEPTSVCLVLAFEAATIGSGLALLIAARAIRVHSPIRERVIKRLGVLGGAVMSMLLLFECCLRLSSHFVRPFDRQRHFFVQHDPNLGWRLRPGVTCAFKQSSVAINSHGLRDDETPYEKPSSTYRILCLGDSQLFGDGVNAQHTFAHLIEQRVDHVEVINAGVIGYGTDQQLLYYLETGFKYEADLVLVVMNASDLGDNISATVRSGYGKPVFRVKRDTLALTNVPINGPNFVSRVNRKLCTWSYLYDVTRRQLVRAFNEWKAHDEVGPNETPSTTHRILPRGDDFDRATFVTCRLLGELAAATASNGAQMAVVFMPYEADFVSDAGYTQRVFTATSMVQQSATGSRFHFIDLRAVMCGGDTTQPRFLDTTHFTVAGHAEVAELLTAELKAEKLLP